jgi:hypothetical protein
MSKVLPFPKDKSKKMTALQRYEAKRLFLSFSLFSVIAVVIGVGQKMNTGRPIYIVAGERTPQMNRAIASTEQMETVENIKWGYTVVNKLNEEERNPAAIGSSPNPVDQLRFGELAGKYRVVESLNRVHEIEYVDSTDVTDRPVQIRDRDAFLRQNKSVFHVSFDSTMIESKSAQDEVYKLFNQKGGPVGKAAFHFDENGRFLSLKVQDK